MFGNRIISRAREVCRFDLNPLCSAQVMAGTFVINPGVEKDNEGFHSLIK